MSNVQDLLKKIDSLRASHGNSLKLDDIAPVINEYFNSEFNEIIKSIQDISGKINKAKVELTTDHPENIVGEFIPNANMELDAVVKHTEQAANEIMEAAEAIQKIADLQNESVRNQVFEHVTRIFEASNFQDLTGQRIRKVIKTMKEIEETINQLLGAISDKVSIEASGEAFKKTEDQKLMEGPQMVGPSQDEIDKLFGSA